MYFSIALLYPHGNVNLLHVQNWPVHMLNKYLACRNLALWVRNRAAENLIKCKGSYYRKTILACINDLALVW